MRPLLAVIAAAALALTGCSSDEEQPNPAPEPTVPTTAPAEPEEVAIELGKPFRLTGGGLVEDLTIHAVSGNPTCDGQPVEGIMLDVEAAVTASDENDPLNTGIVDERTKDGFTKNDVLVSRACNDREDLPDTARSGEKYRGVVWLDESVAADSTLIIRPPRTPHPAEVFVLDLGGAIDESSDAAADPVAPEDAAGSAPAETVAAEPTVVECLEGTPGPALWSDGSTRYSEWCFQSRGGPAAAEAEGNSGLHGPNHQQEMGQTGASEKEAAHAWWSECMATNSPEFCRANDPYQ